MTNKLKKQRSALNKHMKTIILGPPGTGKTTTLLNLVDQFIQDGIRPRQIGYFSFTKKAATEAATRAADKFGLDIENDLAFFRTLHSYAFNQLGMTKEKMMDANDYKEFAYKINKSEKGHYSLLRIDSKSSTFNEIERIQKLNEDILRFITIKTEEISKEPSKQRKT